MATAPLGNVGALSTQWQSAVEKSEQKPSGFAKLTGVFSKPTSSANEVVNTREAFKGFFQSQVKLLGAGIPQQSSAGFQARAQELCDSILENSLDHAMQDAIARGDGKVSDKVLRQAVTQANSKALEALAELKGYSAGLRQSEVRHVDIRPQAFPRFDKVFRSTVTAHLFRSSIA